MIPLLFANDDGREAAPVLNFSRIDRFFPGRRLISAIQYHPFLQVVTWSSVANMTAAVTKPALAREALRRSLNNLTLQQCSARLLCFRATENHHTYRSVSPR